MHHKVGTFLNRFRRDTRGSIAVLTSVTVLVLIMGVGLAYDTTNIKAAEQRLRNMADQTALAGAVVARNGAMIRQDTAKEYFDNARATETQMMVNPTPSIVFDDGIAEVEVVLTSSVDTVFMSLFGKSKVDISASSITGYSIDNFDPISVMLVLDVSGSMGEATTGGQTRIEALQDAAKDLFTEMMAASENESILRSTMRTGMVTYNTAVVDSKNLQFDYIHLTPEIDLMFASGGTNSTEALEFARDQLLNDSLQPNWKGYLVFMTDGNNNDPSFDVASQAYCDEMRDAGYQLFTVGFEAPANGEALLQYCASAPEFYFDSSNSEDLKSAFEQIGREIAQQNIRIKS